MTQAVAIGANSNVSKSPGLPLRMDVESPQAKWKRDAAQARPDGTAGAGGKPALKPGTGPRPGGLDDMPVVAHAPDERRHLGGYLGNVGGAARLAVREEIGNHKVRALFFPKRTAVYAAIAFIGHLFGGRK